MPCRSRRNRLNVNFLKGEHALLIEQLGEIVGQENVEIKVEAAKMIYGKVSKEVDTLDRGEKLIEDCSVMRKFDLNEAANVLIVEKSVLPVRMKQLEVGCGCPGERGQEATFSSLDKSARYHAAMSPGATGTGANSL